MRRRSSRVSKLVIPNRGAVIQTRPVQHRRCAVVQATVAATQSLRNSMPRYFRRSPMRREIERRMGRISGCIPQGRGGSWTERTVS